MGMEVLITGYQGRLGRYYYDIYSDAPDVMVYPVDIKDGYDCKQIFRTDDKVFDLVIHCASSDTAFDDSLMDELFFDWVQRTGQRRAFYFSPETRATALTQ